MCYAPTPDKGRIRTFHPPALHALYLVVIIELELIRRRIGIGQQSGDLLNFITALNSNCLTEDVDSRVAFVAEAFVIRLLKRLRDDMLDVWLHEGLKLMKRVTECPGHGKDCSRYRTNQLCYQPICRIRSRMSALY
jgi:hypothetical protein